MDGEEDVVQTRTRRHREIDTRMKIALIVTAFVAVAIVLLTAILDATAK